MHSPVLDVVSRPILCTMVKLSDSLVFSDKECQHFRKIRPSFGPFFQLPGRKMSHFYYCNRLDVIIFHVRIYLSEVLNVTLWE